MLTELTPYKNDDVDHETQAGFMESFNTTTVLDLTDTINELKQARKRK